MEREVEVVDLAAMSSQITDEDAPVVTYDGGASIYGKDSWRWLLLQPFAAE